MQIHFYDKKISERRDVTRARIEELLTPTSFDITALYEATSDFNDAVYKHMYITDKGLRDTAGELYTLSRVVLGNITYD